MTLIPHKHQVDAIVAVTDAFKISDRTTIVMACGTGKTLVSLLIADHIRSQRIIIFVPSLALVKQTIEYWRKYCSDIQLLAFCSLTRVVDDDINLDDCDIPVTNNVNELMAFLENKSVKHNVVVSTYQSSYMIPSSARFDYGIFDEAHKTAHDAVAGFRFPLFDSNISICKRLFLTATPKIYKYYQKNAYILDYSMDNKEIYGEISYKLDFKDAVSEKIICDYKILISVITKNEIADLVNNNFFIKCGNKHQNLDTFAHIITLDKVLKSYPIKKTITFHRTIKESQEFVHLAQPVLFKSGLNQISHINGKMSHKHREALIHNFDQGTSLLSNVRCLSEGVDIPAIDLVAFLSPKKSKIDIIQACGRAMRISAGKECGYILLPIYCPEEEIDFSEYNYVWNTLSALRYYDSTIQEEFNEPEDLKLFKKYNKQSKNKKVIFLDTKELHNNFNKSISVFIAKRFRDDWQEKFEALKRYYDLNGTFVMSYRSNDNEIKKLSSWTRWLRSNRKEGLLSQDKIDQLDSINFVWSPEEYRWMQRYEKCKREIIKHGVKYINNDTWFYYVRTKYYENKLNNKQKELFLELIKLIPNGDRYLSTIKSTEQVFDRNYKKLLDYYIKHGTCEVPERVDKNLYKWRRKLINRKNKLSPDKIKKLNAINFKWKKAATWQENYESLVAYKKKYGSFIIKRVHNASNLAAWSARQRAAYKNNKLPKEHYLKLKKIGFFNDDRKKWRKIT